MFEHIHEASTSFDAALSSEVFLKCDRKSAGECRIWYSRLLLAVVVWTWSDEELDKELVWILCDPEAERSDEKALEGC